MVLDPIHRCNFQLLFLVGLGGNSWISTKTTAQASISKSQKRTETTQCPATGTLAAIKNNWLLKVACIIHMLYKELMCIYSGVPELVLSSDLETQSNFKYIFEIAFTCQNWKHNFNLKMNRNLLSNRE